LKDLIADFVILIVEYAFLADGIIPAFGADLFPVNEHDDVLNDDFQCFGHRFIQNPSDSS
jgi:hypothetical protein